MTLVVEALMLTFFLAGFLTTLVLVAIVSASTSLPSSSNSEPLDAMLDEMETEIG